MENKKSKTLSMTSTILLTIYTVFMVLAEVGLLTICKLMRELSAEGFDIATNAITSGGCVANYALPGATFGGLFTGLGSLAWIVISSFVVFFVVLCTVYIAVTAISYLLVKRKYYKADAWMKIAVFGTTFLGFILGTNLSCLQMFCMTILLVLPIIISVMVLFEECPCECACKCEKKEEKTEAKEPEKTVSASEEAAKNSVNDTVEKTEESEN